MGVDGWRLVGQGLLVPAAVLGDEQWRAKFNGGPGPRNEVKTDQNMQCKE